jgi:hypothetical protein
VSAKVTLIIMGVALEVLGLVLTASPELAPRIRRVAVAGRRVAGRLEGPVRRILRRPKHVFGKSSVGEFSIRGGRASGYVSVANDAPLERKLEFLMRQAVRDQERLNELEHRVADMPREWRTEVEATRTALEARIVHELEQARELFIVQRLIGLTCIAAGSVVLAVVNLL